MENDVLCSRQEPGCLRFDFMQIKGTENKFIVYETYENEAAVKHHVMTPHFAAVRDFLHSGGGAMHIDVIEANAVDFQWVA